MIKGAPVHRVLKGRFGSTKRRRSNSSGSKIRSKSVAVEVRCGAPLMMGDERFNAAEIVLESGFVKGPVGLQLSLGDLDDWERCLDALQAEEGAEWPATGRGAWLYLVPKDPVEVTVHDSPATQISVRVPIDVASDGLEQNRLRLEHIRKAVGHSS